MKTIYKTLLFIMLVVAGLSGYSQCLAPSFYYTIGAAGQVTFYNRSAWDTLNSGQTTTNTWNFGDGQTLVSDTNMVNHTYAAVGNYTVTLQITSTGCDSTTSQTLNINLCQTGAQFTETNTGFGTYSFTATNLLSLPGSTVLWNFGDGGTSAATSPTYNYSAGDSAGGDPYLVSLIVTDPNLSCADTVYNYVYVSLCNYPVYIDTAVLSYNPVDIQFQPSAVNPSYSYNWAFSDGGTGTGATTTHSYVGSGTYTTTLTISDATTGCSLPVSATFNVNLCGGFISFANGGNGLTQNFYSFNYDSVNLGTGNIATYAWNFTGATPATANTANVNNVVYPVAGTYSVCLYATTIGGCIDTSCKTITVTPPVFSITGSVAKNGGSGFVGTVYLIVQDSIGHLALIDSMTNIVDTALNGYGYGFHNLPVDTYYVKAALNSNDPDYASYLPTYFGDVLTWGAATAIDLNNGNTTADITLVAGSNPGGPGFVGGYVSQGAGLVLGGANNLSKSAGAPLQGVQINLLNSLGDAVAYTYTDVNGKYSFANLALGTYSIYAEQLNKIPSPLDFTLTQANPTDTGADITINSRTATGVNSVGNVEISDVYPNPVSSIVQLLIGCKLDANAAIKLVDVLGRTALTQQTKLTSGENTIELNMAAMAAGVYQLVIQTGSNQLGYKLVKAK